jgi:hypothetical protein
MIKPDDIPNDLEEMCQAIEWFQCGDTDKPAIAAILNAAIEAGVVSPPCWEVVGETIHNVTVFKRQDDARRWVEADRGFRKSEMRHWKGEAE